MIKTESKRSYGFRFETSFKGGCLPCQSESKSVTPLVRASYISETSTKNGVPVPGYRQKIANGIDASSAYTFQRVTSRKAAIIYRQDAKDVACRCDQGTFPNKRTFVVNRLGGYYSETQDFEYAFDAPSLPATIGSTERAQCDAEASQRVHSAITNKLRTGLLGESALQGVHKFVETLKHPFRRAVGLSRRYARSHAKRVSRTRRQIRAADLRARANIASIRSSAIAQHLKTAGVRDVIAARERAVGLLHSKFVRRAKQDWLTYSFGFQNILMDIDALIRANERSVGMSSETTRVVGYCEVAPTCLPSFGLVGMNYWSNTYSTKRSATYKSKYTFGIATKSIAKEYTSVTSQVGFSAESFIPTLWAAFPHSWAIDYFVNVDNLLESWLNRRVVIKYGSFSYKARQFAETSYGTKGEDSTRYFTCITLHTGMSETITYSRVPVGILPSVDLNVTVPRSWQAFANLFSVYHQPRRPK